MRHRVTLCYVLLVLAAWPASAQTTTTRTDRLIASTQAIVGATSLGAHTLNVTGTLGVSGTTTLADLGATGNVTLTQTTGSHQSRTVSTTGLEWHLRANAGKDNFISLTENAVADRWVIRSPAGSASLFLATGNPTTHTNRVEFSDGTVQPATGYSGSLGSLTRKWLTLHAAELWVQTLVASNVMATIGGRILVAPTTQLSADLGSGAGDTTITVKHNTLASGDRIYLEADGKVEFMAVTSGAGGSAGAYTYSVTRDLDTSGRNLWYAGDAVANTGTTGDGFMDIYADRGVASGGYGPTIVGHERLSATYNDWEPRWAIGNLRGLYGYTADTYGAAFGDDDTSNLVIDSTNGIRFRNGTTVLGSWSGSTVTLGQPLTSNNTGQIVIDSDSIDFKWRDNSGNTSTVFEILNVSGGGQVRATSSLVTPLVQRSGGDLTLKTTTTGSYIVFETTGGGVRPFSDNAIPLGNSTYQWSAVHSEAYYVGTTAGVSGTCASVTVVNGIVTGCTP